MFIKFLKKILPWLITAGIFIYLFNSYKPREIWAAASNISFLPFLLIAGLYFVIVFVVDVFAIDKTFQMLSKPIGFKDTLIARGATYLIMIINYPASQAAFGYYMWRKHKTPIYEVLGVFLIIVFIDLLWISGLALAGSFYQDFKLAGIDLKDTTQILGICVFSAAAAWIFFWRKIAPRLHANTNTFIGRFLSKKAFEIFRKARFCDYLKIAAMRMPIHMTVIVCMFIVIRTLGAQIPFTKILGNMPLVFLVGTLPITPGGLGTSNVAFVELLAPYVTGAVVLQVGAKQILLAASLLWVFANYSLKALVGGCMLKRASVNLFKQIKVPEEKVEREATHLGGNL